MMHRKLEAKATGNAGKNVVPDIVKAPDLRVRRSLMY